VESAASKGEKELRTEGRSIAEDAEAKYDSAKDATKDKLLQARDSTERYYNETVSAVDQKAAEAREAANKKAEEAKQSWYSWLGWGKSSVENGAHKVESEADRMKREAAEQVADAAQTVRARAEKSA
jgi:hypothetical protein